MYPKSLDSAVPTKTHFMNSFRQNYLERVLQKMDELLASHREMYDESEWYDSTFFFEDAEETLGFVFVACQVFISGTIADCSNRSEMPVPTKAKEKAMKNAPQFNGARTRLNSSMRQQTITSIRTREPHWANQKKYWIPTSF